MKETKFVYDPNYQNGPKRPRKKVGIIKTGTVAAFVLLVAVAAFDRVNGHHIWVRSQGLAELPQNPAAVKAHANCDSLMRDFQTVDATVEDSLSTMHDSMEIANLRQRYQAAAAEVAESCADTVKTLPHDRIYWVIYAQAKKVAFAAGW